MEKRLIKKEHIILSKVYQLRVMTYPQIFTYIVKDSTENYCSKLVKNLVSNNYLEKTGTRKTNFKYYITNKGISYLRDNGIYTIGSSELQTYSKFLTAEQIRISDKVSNHQLALNDFVLSYEQTSPSDFIYYDEKYVSNIFNNIRPDGLIKTDDAYYFLELDMNTERKNRLIQKWESYRLFFRSYDADKFGENIKVLFIIEGNTKVQEKRSNELSKYIYDNLYTYISDKINFYIGSKQELFDNAIYHTDEDIVAFFTSYGFLNKKLYFKNMGNIQYDSYIYKTNSEKKIMSLNGDAMDFLVDNYMDKNSYVYLKYVTFDTFNAYFSSKFKRDIKYIIIVSEETVAFNLIKSSDVNNANVYFTTKERLSCNDFFAALFKIDTFGNLYHFKDDLKNQIQEKNLGEL